ncbi:hypothetical protein GP486_004297 [Trichoglossum hirsutum]|uniref:Uncharacterized protein n=1 Tax=Trichoglossum hirsutum TaxID=265104 RepID=A0A9P8LBF7_9PEZI|nr:hypothetical protein GP486_004297 [Trichoglossum hirsutum]
MTNTNGLANRGTATELVARGSNDPIPPVPVLVGLFLAFFNAGPMFITPVQEHNFATPNTLAPLNTQNAGADVLNGRIATAVAANTGGPLSLRNVPLVQNRPFEVTLTLVPSDGLNWAQIAQRAGGVANLQAIVTQGVQRVITGNVETGTYNMNIRAQNQVPGAQPVGFVVCTLNIQIEGRSAFED